MSSIFVWTFEGIVQAVFLAIFLIVIAVAGVAHGVAYLYDKWKDRRGTE